MNKKLIIVLAIILIITITIIINKTNKICNSDNGIIQDTITNMTTIDSVVIVIKEKDSIINKLKINANEEIESALNDNDSLAVERFYKLVLE